MKSYCMYIGGAWCEAHSGQWFETDNPYTQEVWALVAKGGAQDVDAAVQAAHCAFVDSPWKCMTASERGRLLYKLGDLILDNTEVLACAEVRDNGKTITEMRAQMQTMAGWYHYYGGLADKIEGGVVPVDEANFLTYTRYEPYGVVALITPWNSPLRLLSWKLGPALAAGNTVVIKPSEYASTSTLELMHLVKEAKFPDGVVNVITGFGTDVGLPLVEHPLVEKIAFTGGPDGGAKVYEAAARMIKPVTLELGGKSPNIIFPDADMNRAVEGAIAGIFNSTGQTCTAGSRLLVHESRQEQVVQRIAEIAGRKHLGDPMRSETEIGPVATAPQLERILRYCNIGRDEGAKLVTGGGRPTGAECGRGRFVQPTLFSNVDNRMRIAQEEIFGPVLSVIPFKDEDDAIRIGNDINFGLAAGVWTENLQRAHRMAAKLRAGTVWINTYRKTVPMMPFGGYKKSGLGRENGMEAIKHYLQPKSVWVALN